MIFLYMVENLKKKTPFKSLILLYNINNRWITINNIPVEYQKKYSGNLPKSIISEYSRWPRPAPIIWDHVEYQTYSGRIPKEFY